ncbi:MAG TPA: hypothetical protein VIH78_07515 [Terriglobales bacterium]
MSKSFVCQALALTAVLALFICGQPAPAQNPHHFQIRSLSPADAGQVFPPKGPVEKKRLEQLSSGFGVLPPVDGGGNDEWPCFPNQNANGADCSSIATGGVVIGQPAFTQSLANCDASASSAPNCGQFFSFYEDDTGDTTDDLVVSIVVKQGVKYILDTGTVDLGTNPFPAGSVVVIYDDTAFGTLGQTGPGNGFCGGSTETCVNPVKGPATATFTITVGTSTIKTTIDMFLE